MPNWEATAANVKKLIDKYGRDVVLIKQGNEPQNVEQPWRAQATYDESSVTGKAVFVTPSDMKFGNAVENKDNVKRTEQVVYFAAADDGGNELENFDVIVDNGVRWKIQHGQVLKPADTRLLYQFEVAR